MPWCESRVVAVKGNDRNQFRSGSCGSYNEDSEGFGLKVTFNLCVRKNRINIEREGAKPGQEQAQKMVSLSNPRLPAVDIGTNVVVRVPHRDRGRLAPRNILAVVVDIVETHGVPSSSLSLRSASMITSEGKQGFVSCHCKRYCIDKKCKCLSKNMKCNSMCHSNSSCKNKWASPLFFIWPSLHVFFFINKLLNL